MRRQGKAILKVTDFVCGGLVTNDCHLEMVGWCCVSWACITDPTSAGSPATTDCHQASTG